MTQLQSAKSGKITDEMIQVAKDESIKVEDLMKLISKGRIVIPANKNHKSLKPIGIGQGLRTKINANIGTSGDFDLLDDELKKIDMVIKYKADAVMDLSTGGDVSLIRKELIKRSTIPFGNVPIYEMVLDILKTGKTFVEMTFDEMLDYIKKQAEDGVDFMTIHAGLTLKAIDKIRKKPRNAGIVSRGGSLIAGWMLHNDKENPLLENFDKILEVSKEYDITLSLGDGLRPGSIADGTDWAQLEELLMLGELVKRSRDYGVQVMVEGPGHLPLNQIEMNIKLQKAICDNAPFYVLGPLVTDIAPGYDHITSAIGGAIAGSVGADFLCYVTPAEHLALPDEQDVKEGIIASRIAAHVADISKGIKGAFEWDKKMGEARRKLDWSSQQKLSIDEAKFRKIRTDRSSNTEACSMCGDLCVYKILKDFYKDLNYD